MQRNNLSSDSDNLSTEFKMLFVRHGETDWSRENILNNDQDLPLNANGLGQAEKTAQFLQVFLKDAANPMLVTSTLQRASQTACLISKTTGIPISEHRSELREFYDYRKVNHFFELPTDAETVDLFQKRIYETLEKLLQEHHQACPLIIVSHQNVFKYLAQHLTHRQATLSPAGIAFFKRDNNDRWEMEILNIKSDVYHRKSLSHS